MAMEVLANALVMSRPEDALLTFEAHSALIRRYWPHDHHGILNAQGNIANCLDQLQRDDESIVLKREDHARRVALFGISDADTIASGLNLSISLNNLRHRHEAASLVRDLLPVARRSLGADHDVTLKLHQVLAESLELNHTSTRNDLLEAETISLNVVQRRRQTFGPAHPQTLLSERVLSNIRARLAHA